MPRGLRLGRIWVVFIDLNPAQGHYPTASQRA